MGASNAELKYGLWYMFGSSPDGKNVDISTSIGNNDILTHIKVEEAQKVIKLHNDMLNELEEIEYGS